MSVSGANDLQALIEAHFSPNQPKRLGVAVSGGSDSLALLVLLHEMFADTGPELFAVTVDHGLRPESADEAREVARICTDLNVSHQILNWSDWDGQGNLQDQARRARYRLMSEWAHSHAINDIALGHTLNDQAETFLMRLSREAGVDGLSAMASSWREDLTTFHRPLLQANREILREFLRSRNIKWAEDPSNDDKVYARVRARNILEKLEPLGINIEGLSSVAQHLSAVRGTLYTYVLKAAKDLVSLEVGDLLIDRAGLEALPPEVSRRLLQTALKWLSGAEYVPRGKAMAGLMQAIFSGPDTTLSGCLIRSAGNHIRLTREYNAVAKIRCDPNTLWDGRWQVDGPELNGAFVAALGNSGLEQCPDWRASGLPMASVIALPALWMDNEILATPLVGMAKDWKIVLRCDLNHFFTTIKSMGDLSVSH